MENKVVYVLTFLYSIGGVIGLTGYIPTIIDLYKENKAANILTYIIWTLTSVTSSLYGFFIIKDLTFNIIINLTLLLCLIILFLAIKLKLKNNVK